MRRRFAVAESLRVSGPGTGSAARRAEALSQPAREHSGSTTTSQPARAASSTARNSSATFAALSPIVTRTWPNPIRRPFRAMAPTVACAVTKRTVYFVTDSRHLAGDRVKEYRLIIAIYGLITLLLLLLNGFFVLAEFAAVRMRPTRVEE